MNDFCERYVLGVLQGSEYVFGVELGEQRQDTFGVTDQNLKFGQCTLQQQRKAGRKTSAPEI